MWAWHSIALLRDSLLKVTPLVEFNHPNEPNARASKNPAPFSQWRIYLLLANRRKRWQRIYFRRIPRSCIREIIIGPRCDPKVTKVILSYLTKPMPKVLMETLTLDVDGYELLKSGTPDRAEYSSRGNHPWNRLWQTCQILRDNHNMAEFVL